MKYISKIFDLSLMKKRLKYIRARNDTESSLTHFFCNLQVACILLAFAPLKKGEYFFMC